jgi:hypothetical protein
MDAFYASIDQRDNPDLSGNTTCDIDAIVDIVTFEGEEGASENPRTAVPKQEETER